MQYLSDLFGCYVKDSYFCSLENKPHTVYMANKTFPTSGEMEEQESGFNYRELIDNVILHWQWFVISVIACLFLSFIYLKYKSPVYSTWTKVLIKEEDPYSRSMRGTGLTDFSQLGLLNNSNGFDNEMEILGSKTLAKRAVTNLKLYVSYAYDGRMRNMELYKETPVLADMSPVDLDTLSSTVTLEITQLENGSYHIEGQALGEEFEAEAKSLPIRVKTLSGWVMLRPNPNPGIVFGDRPLLISINRPAWMANSFMSRTGLEPTSKLTTVAQISITDTRRDRAEDYLNELIRAYNEDANEVKNEVALKTEAFINKRIQIIDAELGDTDSQLESYKKRNQLVNLTSDAQAAYKGIENYQEKQIEMQTQMLLVKSLKEYVDNPANYMEIIPANLGLTDDALNNIISKYNTEVVERKRLLKTAPENSPVVVAATNAIAALYPGIRHSLASVYDNLRVQKRNIDDQYNLFIARLSSTPTQERVLTDMGRQQTVKATLYQILLQKREENAISLASTVDKAQVIDAPESSIQPISPKRKIIGLIALFMGVAIPAGALYLCNLLRYRIEGRNDIEKLTEIPLLGDIFTSKESKEGVQTIVVRENTNDIMEEAFRNVRVQLGFIMKKSEKVLMCTSVIPGEGKTFVSTNLAMSLALMGRKALVVGLDIRKPRLAKLFGLHTGNHGITTYLAGEDSSDEFLKEQIFHSGIHDNLDVLPAGLIPPNPAELVSSDRLDDAFARLRNWYDIIIVDTPPIGAVSDTLLLGRIADATIVVCRCDYSLKRNFNIINRIHNEQKLPKMSLVLNGVDLQQRKYGYYYGVGKYANYGGRYGSYGTYGNYGHYEQNRPLKKGEKRTSSPAQKGQFIREDRIDDKK